MTTNAKTELVTHQEGVLSRGLRLEDWVRRETTTAIADVLAHFLLNCRSVHTRRNYGNDIRGFLEFAASAGIPVTDVRDITEKLVLLWQEELKARHTRYAGARRRVVQTSVARHLSALSSMLDFAVKRGLIEKNCTKLISRPKLKRESKTNAMTADELRRMLDVAMREAEETRAEGGIGYRSARLRYAVLFTLLSVGMRVDELCELRIGDIELAPDFARLHMTAKGGETHSPIIHANTVRVLQDYIEEFRAGASPGELLFVRAQRVRRTSKLTQVAVYLMIRELAEKAGIDKRLSPHSCRATLATVLHNHGVPIGQIQDLLNHKQILTTAIYIKKAQELAESAATKVDITAL